MEEERIKVVKTRPEPQSVRNISVFLDFANFYRRFIRNFNRITAPLILILQITNKSTGDETQSIQAEKQSVPGSAGAGGTNDVDRHIKNLSSVIKSVKFKKPSFVKVNSSGTDFLCYFVEIKQKFSTTFYPKTNG